jgi:hypothetical protein
MQGQIQNLRKEGADRPHPLPSLDPTLYGYDRKFRTS